MATSRPSAFRRLALPWLLAATLLAVPGGNAVRGAGTDPASPEQAKLVEKLYAPVERQADFEDIAARAAGAKVPAQTIAEARLAFCIRTGNLDDRLTGTIRELDEMCAGLRWKKEDSKLFNSPAETAGALSFARALLAGKQGDEPEYERCVKEAFWQNPAMGPLIAGEVRVHRDWVTRVSKLTVPLDRPIQDLAGRPVKLGELLRGKKGLLLEFWASWCEPCMARMDVVKARAARLAKSDVMVVGINVEGDQRGAEKVRGDQQMSFPWLMETRDRPLSRLLQVDAIPNAVLVGADGRVRFRGHPDDPALGEALGQMGVPAEN